MQESDDRMLVQNIFSGMGKFYFVYVFGGWFEFESKVTHMLHKNTAT